MSVKSEASATATESPSTPDSMGKIAVDCEPSSTVGWLRTIVATLLCLLSLVVGVGGFAYLASLREAPARREPTARPLVVTTYEITPSDVREIVSVYGTSRAEREVQLNAQVAGQIIDTFKLNIGERVEAPKVDATSGVKTEHYPGDVVIKIDPKTYQEKLNLAMSKLDEVAAEKSSQLQEKINLQSKLSIQEQSLATYQKEYDRIALLHEQGKVLNSDLDRARLELIGYQDGIDTLKSQLALIPKKIEQLDRKAATLENDVRMAELDIERTSVIPSFNGIVSDVAVELGQYVRLGDPLVKIVDVSKIEIPVAISIDDQRRILSQWMTDKKIQVSIAMNQREDEVWSGHIVRFSPVADERTRTAEVFVEVDNAAQKSPLVPGTFVNIRIETQLQKNVLLIPRSSIIDGFVLVYEEVEEEVTLEETEKTTEKASSEAETTTTVDKVVERKTKLLTRKVPVKVDSYLQNMAIVSEGLSEGDKIIVTNLDLLNELLSTGETYTLIESETQNVRKYERDQRIRQWELLHRDKGLSSVTP